MDAAAKTYRVEGRTLVFDRDNQRQVLWLDGVVVLPPGSEIELTSPNVNAVVRNVRLLAGDPAIVTLDVVVPDEWWADRAYHD